MLNRRSRGAIAAAIPARDALQEIGGELREARERRGERLVDVANYLCIRPHYLQALEDGDTDNLPASVYMIGFLKSYAEHLGMSPGDLALRARGAVRAVTRDPAIRLRIPQAERRRSGVALGFLSVMVVVGVYAGWYARQERQPVDSGIMAPPPLIAEGVLAPKATEPAMVPPAPRIKPMPTQLAAALPADPLPVPAPVLATDAPSEQAPQPPHVSPTEASAGEMLASLAGGATPGVMPTTPPARVVIVARDVSWIQVRSASRDWVRTRTLVAGERLELPDRTDLALWTGNAGGIDVLLDGQSIGTIGQPHQVVRELALDPAQLKALPILR